MQRQTRQRAAIQAVFAAENRPLSPREALELATGNEPGLGIATVYRAIRDLTESGFLQAVDLPGEPQRFQPRRDGHHHHFRCLRCGKLFVLDACHVNEHPPAVPAGFVVRGHYLLLTGHCSDCAAAGTGAAPAAATPKKRKAGHKHG